LTFLSLVGLLTGLVHAETAAEPVVEAPVADVAAEPIYQVEFIVVRPRHREDLQAEDWPNVRPELASDALTAGDYAPEQPLESTPDFSWVEEAQWDFPNTLRRLQESGAYEVLMHRSWRQQATPRKNAVPYLVKLPFDDRNAPTQLAAGNIASDYSYSNALQNAGNADDAGLVGTVAFGKARYLHFTIDLLMSENSQSNQSSWQGNWQTQSVIGSSAEQLGLSNFQQAPLKHFHLQESRRIKTEETQYFDHPGFAVLAHVRRLEP
jgi:hypothetical protein